MQKCTNPRRSFTEKRRKAILVLLRLLDRQLATRDFGFLDKRQLQHAVVVKACCMASGQAHDTLPFAR